MSNFTYKALDENSKLIKAVIEASDVNDAKERLKIKGLKIISINKQSDLLYLKFGHRLLKDEEAGSFCGQVATVLNAGLTIINGLEVIKDQDKKLKKLVSSILEGVRRGETLSKSMEATGVFQKLLINMIRAGELSGNVDEILFNMEQYYQKEATIKNKVKGASIYPSILVVMTIFMLIFFNFFIIPKMKNIFESNSNLPWITKMLLSSNKYITNNFVQIIAVLFISIVILVSIKRMPKVKYQMDKISLGIPILGFLKSQVITSRFTRSMNIFLRSSVPLLEAFNNISTIVNNDYVGKKIELAKKEIISGSSIATSLKALGVFEPLVIQLIKIGEETGKLDEMFAKLADIYDKRTDTAIQKLMIMIEPAFTLIIGIIVAIIVIAMALPILNMAELVK